MRELNNKEVQEVTGGSTGTAAVVPVVGAVGSAVGAAKKAYDDAKKEVLEFFGVE